MIKAVFFDVANTLLNKPLLFVRMQEVLNRHGYTIPDALLVKHHRLLSEVISFPDKTSRDFYTGFNAELLLSLGIEPKDELIAQLFESCTYLPWEPFADTSFIKEISLPIGILSNWDNSLAEKLKQYFSTEFQWILGSQDSGKRKPDLAFFELMLNATGFEPPEILYVGDSLKLDIVPANRLGIKAILIDRPHLFPFGGFARVNDLYQLKQYL